tara:strand:- start:224 stop:607 length:384 start_codon:yes stop_codon:yes gene_type:complete
MMSGHLAMMPLAFQQENVMQKIVLNINNKKVKADDERVEQVLKANVNDKIFFIRSLRVVLGVSLQEALNIMALMGDEIARCKQGKLLSVRDYPQHRYTHRNMFTKKSKRKIFKLKIINFLKRLGVMS